MEASVNISSKELKRLFKSSVKTGLFTEAFVFEMTKTLLARVESDYPKLMHKLHMEMSRRYKRILEKERREQKSFNKSNRSNYD